MSIGENVRQIRLEQRYTQTEIARRCGVTPAAISGLEHGDFTPSTSLLARLAKALDVTADELLKAPVPLAKASGTGPASPQPPQSIHVPLGDESEGGPAPTYIRHNVLTPDIMERVAAGDLSVDEAMDMAREQLRAIVAAGSPDG